MNQNICECKQNDKKLICEIDDHIEEINMFCFIHHVISKVLNCCKCIKEGNHNSHHQNLKPISSLRDFNEKLNKECDNLIDDLSKQVGLINKQFAKLKEGIRNKFQLQSKQLLNLNYCQ
ncbi:unnamed protein product [Paramecium octaurelia]|uniref:Uncharacterized protein n=1 Tax=Paramecium octaurelia TaxID=43137 RepID=A0A8S1VMU0_PAROT|nr:unnamed protein product [Paramecium octaurelia]